MGTGLYLQQEYLYRPLPYRISTIGRFNNFAYFGQFNDTPSWTSTAWPTNNLAIYVPISLSARFTVARFVVANGANSTGNVDVGLYSAAGTRLISTGSTARAGTSVLQYIGVTDQSFPPGHYYLALVASSTTGSYMKTWTGQDQYIGRMCGLLQEALGATTLPTSMTPVAFTGAGVFAWGFSQSDTF